MPSAAQPDDTQTQSPSETINPGTSLNIYSDRGHLNIPFTSLVPVSLLDPGALVHVTSLMGNVRLQPKRLVRPLHCSRLLAYLSW